MKLSKEDLQIYEPATMEALGILVPKKAVECTELSLKYSDERNYKNLTWESHELQTDINNNPFFYKSPMRHVSQEALQSLGFANQGKLEEFLKEVEKEPSPHIEVIESPQDPNLAIVIPFYRHGLMNLCLAHYDGELNKEQQEKIDYVKKAIKDLMVVYSALCCYTEELIKDEPLRNLYEHTRSATDILTKHIEPKYNEALRELTIYFREYFNDEGPYADKGEPDKPNKITLN